MRTLTDTASRLPVRGAFLAFAIHDLGGERGLVKTGAASIVLGLLTLAWAHVTVEEAAGRCQSNSA